MKRLINDKRGIEILHGVIVFVVLNIMFIAGMFIYIGRAGAGVGFVEQAKAKEIALLIDEMKDGTSVTMNISDLYELAKENKYEEEPVKIIYEENKVRVALRKGKGYSYFYFTDLVSGSVSIDNTNKTLIIKT